MTFPISYFIYPYFFFLAIWAILSLIAVFHMMKYSFRSFIAFFMTFSYLAVSFLLLMVFYNYFSAVDWQTNISIFEGIFNQNSFVI